MNMTCNDLLTYLISTADPDLTSSLISENGVLKTCDCIKTGNGDAQVKKAAVTMFATPDVIKSAVEFGAELLIVHEPLYYNHWDTELPNEAARIKEKYIADSGLTIFRFHDHAHARTDDLIFEGEMMLLGLKGHTVSRSYAHTSFMLDESMTAAELARLAEERLGAKHVRIAGCADKPGRRISCSFGAAGDVAGELENNDFYICGEICEWSDGELVRDYAQLGFNKALIVLSHEVSERAGMMLLTRELKEKYPDIEFRYLESGSLYSYTEDIQT